MIHPTRCGLFYSLGKRIISKAVKCPDRKRDTPKQWHTAVSSRHPVVTEKNLHVLVSTQQSRSTSLLISQLFSLTSLLGQRAIPPFTWCKLWWLTKDFSQAHANKDLQETFSGPFNMESGQPPKTCQEGRLWTRGISFLSEPSSTGNQRAVVNLTPAFILWTFPCQSFKRPHFLPLNGSHKPLQGQ